MTSYKITRINLLKNFQCLGDKCEDTCCRGWGMQVDKKTKELYEKETPELLEAITTGEADIIMKRDTSTDTCVKLEGGFCSIHSKYGTKFLGDACHFYPRITRKFGDINIMSAATSCPEIVRLALFSENPFEFDETEIDRLPSEVKEYAHPELNEEQILKTIRSFSDAAKDVEASPERIMCRIISVAGSLSRMEVKSWPDAAAFFLKSADGRLLPPEDNENDPYLLVQTLAALIYASKKTSRPRLEETIKTIEEALNIKIDWSNLNITITNNKNSVPYSTLLENWKNYSAETINPFLK